MKRIALAALVAWTPCIETATASTKTAGLEQITLKKKLIPDKKTVAAKPAAKKILAPHVKAASLAPVAIVQTKQEYTDTPLITVFNTSLTTQTLSPIVIKAHCLSNSNGIATKSTKTLEAANPNQDHLINPQTFQVLQVPEGAFELWAEQVNTIDHYFETIHPIPFSLKKETEILIFEIKEDKTQTLQFVSPLQESTLLFYNQTDKDYTLSFSGTQNLLGFSYSAKQVSFTIPAGKIITLPLPQNAASWTIGNNNPVLCVAPKKIYSLTSSTLTNSANPVITELVNSTP